MMRGLLILAALCAALLVVLALTRGGPRPQMTAGPPEAAPAAEQAAKPAAAKVPAPADAPPAKAEPVDTQMADDAAAVGMTTREPRPEERAAPEAPDEKK